MECEGMCIPQGGGRAFRGGCGRSLREFVIAVLIISICACTVHAGLFDKNKHCEPQTGKSVESENISARIEQLVRGLGYCDKVAKDFVGMVDRWESRKGIAFFAARRQKLCEVRGDYKQGRISIADVAKVEKKIVSEIAWLIERKFYCADEDFELADVIKNNQASCLGFTQLFYVLCDSVGLSFIPINVVELQTGGPLPTGAAHISCMVSLSDGRIIMLNSVPGGFSVSEPFTLAQEFTKVGNYWQLTDSDNPLDIYRKIEVLDKDGLAAYVYSNRGIVRASAGEFNEAIANFTRAIELNPSFADAYNHRGIAYRNLGQLKQAVSDYTRAIELKPDYAEAYNNRGVAYVKLGEPERGIGDYDKSIELNPGFAEAYNNRANAYAKSGQFEQAVSDYTRAIKNNPQFAKAYGNRAVTYALLGRAEGAKKDLLKANNLDSTLKTRVKQISDDFRLNLKLD